MHKANVSQLSQQPVTCLGMNVYVSRASNLLITAIKCALSNVQTRTLLAVIEKEYRKVLLFFNFTNESKTYSKYMNC